MINNEKYKEVLEAGLLMDHYFVLCSMKTGTELPSSKRIQGFINLLTKKGYIENDELTEMALDMIGECEEPNIVVDEKEEKVDYKSWINKVYVACQSRLKERTGTVQYRAVLDKKKSYSFLPNIIDFSKALSKVVNLYKLKDYNKVERCLLGHIDRCADENNWFPLMQYYIIKNGFSQLVTDYEAPEEEPKEEKSSQKFV